MNLVAKIKRLEAEVAELRSRLDAPKAEPWAAAMPLLEKMLAEGDEKYLGIEAHPKEAQPKKRKPRAKTSTTE